ncbi:MAG: hypothetical protein J5870_03560 [Clostridia bacterium]|nr:hypothetical protein [Clostridia bacterium]
MKKAIVALLTTILAAFGYVVVDKTTDARLADLEKQASSQNSVISFQQEEIESLRNKENYTSENINEYTELDSLIGKTIEYTGQKKFMFRLYHNGEIKYVPTGKTDLIDETKEPDTNKIPTSELSGDGWALAPGEEYNG